MFYAKESTRIALPSPSYLTGIEKKKKRKELEINLLQPRPKIFLEILPRDLIATNQLDECYINRIYDIGTGNWKWKAFGYPIISTR